MAVPGSNCNPGTNARRFFLAEPSGRGGRPQDERRFSQFKERKARATEAYCPYVREPETAARHRNAENGLVLTPQCPPWPQVGFGSNVSFTNFPPDIQ
jgi:hypothetical protein